MNLVCASRLKISFFSNTAAGIFVPCCYHVETTILSEVCVFYRQCTPANNPFNDDGEEKEEKEEDERCSC